MFPSVLLPLSLLLLILALLIVFWFLFKFRYYHIVYLEDILLFVLAHAWIDECEKSSPASAHPS